jgi:RND family efflux transporter MFP subunit
VALVALASLVLLAACGDDPAPAPEEAASAPDPIPVRVLHLDGAADTADTANVPSLRTSGRLASRVESDLAFKVPGYVSELRVDEGDAVEAGQVLARLQDTEVEARVRSARTRARVARKDLDRMERLLADSVVPEARVDDARNAWEQARSTLEVAEYDATHATIRAPSRGRILRRHVEVSEFVGAGTPILRLGAPQSGWVVRLALADREVVRIRRHDAALITLSALDGDDLRGRVTEISDQADPASGTFEVEVTLEPDSLPPDAANLLRSGMVATVALTPSTDRGTVRVPTRALVDTEGRNAAVFRVVDGRARRTPVRIHRIGAEGVVLRRPEGATAAEWPEGGPVVTDGAAYLRDGDPVEVVEGGSGSGDEIVGTASPSAPAVGDQP